MSAEEFARWSAEKDDCYCQLFRQYQYEAMRQVYPSTKDRGLDRITKNLPDDWTIYISFTADSPRGFLLTKRGVVVARGAERGLSMPFEVLEYVYDTPEARAMIDGVMAAKRLADEMDRAAEAKAVSLEVAQAKYRHKQQARRALFGDEQ